MTIVEDRPVITGGVDTHGVRVRFVVVLDRGWLRT